METLELPLTEELEDTLSWPGHPPVDIAEQEMDLAAFRLLREACRPVTAADQDAEERE